MSNLRSRRVIDGLVVATSAAFLAAVVVSIVRTAQLEPKIRAVTGPGLLARTAVLTMFVVLPLVALRTHRFLFAESAFLMFAFLIGDYASEDLLAPVAGVTIALFIVAYAKRSEQPRFPGTVRTGVVIVSAALGVAALSAAHLNPRTLIWERTTKQDRTTSVFTKTFDGTCGTLATREFPSPGAESGCDQYVPHLPARAATGLAVLCMVAGGAAGFRLKEHDRLKSAR